MIYYLIFTFFKFFDEIHLIHKYYFNKSNNLIIVRMLISEKLNIYKLDKKNIYDLYRTI